MHHQRGLHAHGGPIATIHSKQPQVRGR